MTTVPSVTQVVAISQASVVLVGVDSVVEMEGSRRKMNEVLSVGGGKGSAFDRNVPSILARRIEQMAGNEVQFIVLMK